MHRTGQSPKCRSRCGTAAILFLLAFLASASPSSASHFDPPLVLHGCPGNYSISVGDVNGDGRNDIVAVSVDSLWVATFLQQPEGGLVPAIHSQLREPCWQAALGDFDEDGKLDLAGPGLYSGWLFLYPGDGDSTFTYQRLYRPPPTFDPIAISAGDLNGDGHTDLVMAGWSTPGVISVFLGAGDGSFPTEIDFPTAAGPTGLALGDLNGDGHPDLVVSCNGYVAPGTDSVYVHLGNGDGTFSAGKAYLAGHLPFHVAIGDLNNDGKPDWAVASFDGTVSTLFGVGDGTFGPPIHYLVGTRPRVVAIGDIDGDGWNDLASADPDDTAHPDSIAVLINNRDGTFRGPSYEFAGVVPWGLALVDLTGDGRLDAVVASRRQDSISFLSNCGACTPTAVEVSLSEQFVDAAGVHLKWLVSQHTGAWAEVERRTPGSDWVVALPPTPIQSSTVTLDDSDVAPGQRYGYRLTLHTSDRMITAGETWVEVPGEGVPKVAVIGPPVPNPMSNSVGFRFGLPLASQAQLSIVDAAGRITRRIQVAGPAGWHWVSWDGRNTLGSPVASGIYFVRLDGSSVAVRRIVVVR